MIWSDVMVNSFEPVINPPGTDPDDEDTSWISADVNIMRWYIRNQNVEELL